MRKEAQARVLTISLGSSYYIQIAGAMIRKARREVRFLFALPPVLLVAEELERPVREVHDGGDDDERHNPVAEVVEHREAAADEELDEVITRPVNDISNRETSRRSEPSRRIRDECIHNDECRYLSLKGRPSLSSCRTRFNELVKKEQISEAHVHEKGTDDGERNGLESIKANEVSSVHNYTRGAVILSIARNTRAIGTVIPATSKKKIAKYTKDTTVEIARVVSAYTAAEGSIILSWDKDAPCYEREKENDNAIHKEPLGISRVLRRRACGHVVAMR